jgi:hypothetical protein
VKRVLAFLLLLTLGFAVLHFAVGDDRVAAVKTGSPANQDRPATTTPGIHVDQRGHPVTVTLIGKFDYTKTRTLPEVDGLAKKEPVYTMHAADSQPIANGQQQLDGVELLLFENGVHSSTLNAARAFLTLRPDANGTPSIDEGKDVDLRDAVLTTMPGSRLAGLRLELANARVRIEDETLQLTTPNDEPVLVVFEGDRRVTMRGHGAQALLPRTRESKLRRADVEILHDPVLDAEGVEVRARGRMHFVEDVDTGAGIVTLDDHVELDLARSHLALPRVGNERGPQAADEVHVRGDHFVGWLQRTFGLDATGTLRDTRDWRQLVLTGAPATIEMPGARLSSPRVTARAGLFGTPELITAHGGESRLEQTELRPGSKQKAPLVGTASRRLHFAMPREQLGAVFASYGAPRWTMRPLERLQVAVAEGTARLHGDADTYEARDGARIYRFDRSDAGVVVGLGPARVEQKATARLERRQTAPGEQDLVATTSSGFVYTARAGDDHLQLGPEEPADLDAPGPWRTHTFDVQQGTATVRGTGVGTVDRAGASTRVHFVAPDARITASLPERGLELRGVRQLDAEIVDKVPVQLDVAGWPVELVLADGKNGGIAKAPHVQQIAERSLRLEPPDAARPALWSGLPAADRLPLLRREIAASGGTGAQQIEVRGPRIDVHHAGGHDALVDAVAVDGVLPYAYARVAARQGGDGGEATTLACGARRIRALPFLVSPAARRWLTADSDALAAVTFHALQHPWLVVDDVRDFQLDDARQGHVEGHGRQLFVSQAARTALFVGDPDSQTPAEIVRTLDGRVTTVRGAEVRAIDDGDVVLEALGAFAERSTFLPPTLTLHDPQRSGLLSHMQATCRGNIEVRPDQVRFSGPVIAHSLDDAGRIDPAGVKLDAEKLHMTRDAKTGEVRVVTGSDVTADLPNIHAKCKDVELDLVSGRIVASDPADAVVRLANGYEITSPRVEVNYQTLVFTTSPGRIVRRDPDARRQ